MSVCAYHQYNEANVCIYVATVYIFILVLIYFHVVTEFDFVLYSHIGGARSYVFFRCAHNSSC